MSKKWIKGISILAVLIIVASVVVVLPMTVGMGAVDKIDFNYDGNRILSKEDVQKDVKQLIRTMEETHPVFIDGEPEGYGAAKAKLKELGSMSGKEFKFAAEEFLAVFDDLHTRVELGSMNDEKGCWTDFSVAVNWDTEKLLIHTDSQGIIPQGAELVSVNGVGYSALIEVFKTLRGLENRYSLMAVLNSLFRKDYLEYAGVDMSGDSAEYLFKFGENTYKRIYQFYTVEEYNRLHPSTGNTPIEPTKNFNVGLKDDIVVIKMRLSRDDGSFDNALEQVNKHIAEGKRKFVLDVTGNGGGNDVYGIKFLEALGLTTVYAEHTTRYSYTTRRYLNTVELSGKKVTPASDKIDNKYGVQLKVIMNEYTASAALTPAARVKFSKLGEIIGRPSLQKPNYYGNITVHSLKRSKLPIAVPISMNRYYLDNDIVGNALMPDVMVDDFADSYWDYITF